MVAIGDTVELPLRQDETSKLGSIGVTKKGLEDLVMSNDKSQPDVAQLVRIPALLRSDNLLIHSGNLSTPFS